ncbi:MAG: CarD family transcriptional regulator [Hyphomicrobium sp.]|nr:CarD family transcriptional regulator [Hyphomicrobiaceae bacterium]
MAQKKKLPATGRSAKSASGKKVARKTVAAKKPGRQVAKPAARKTVAKAASAKSKKPTARKTSVSAATVKARAKSARGKAAAASRTVKPVATKVAVAKKAAPARAVAAAVKPAAQKITASVAEKTAPAAKAAPTPKSIAEKVVVARQLMAAKKKPVNQRHGFKISDFVVYPAHGVGRIVGIEEQEIAGISLELFVLNFEKEKLTLRVPTGKLESVGMRKLAEEGVVKKAMDTLKGRARVKRTMWSRRAQEYVAKINSGDLVSIAEVVRDLYRSDAQPEQSYSERQLYEDALDRMAREIAVVEKLDERGAVQRITEVLSKSARGRRLAAEAAEAAEANGDESRAA